MFRHRFALLPEQPALQPIETDIDNRRDIEREKLRQRETADDGVTKRLANFRSDAGRLTARCRPED